MSQSKKKLTPILAIISILIGIGCILYILNPLGIFP